jgi:hypothetical protein
MADENQEVEVQEERQYSDDEVKAMDHGWVPKDEWKGSPDEWVPAKVFNLKGELFGRIAKDKATIAELKQSVDALVDHNKKLFDAGYKKAIVDLKAQKQAALEEGDTRAVMEIDDKIEEVREEAAKAKEEFEQKTAAKAVTVNPTFEAWHASNQWYLQDRVATEYANEIAQQMFAAANNAGKQVEADKLYNEVTRKVRQKFPEKFETRSPARMKADPVGSSDDVVSEKPATPGGSLKESDLTEDQRRIMNNIIKSSGGKMTKKDYLEQMAQFETRKNGRR